MASPKNAIYNHMGGLLHLLQMALPHCWTCPGPLVKRVSLRMEFVRGRLAKSIPLQHLMARDQLGSVGECSMFSAL